MYLKVDFNDFIEELQYFDINAFTCRGQKHFTINITEKKSQMTDVLEVCVANDNEYKILNRTLRTIYNENHI